MVEKYISVLKRTRLFAGLGEEEIRAMTGCLGAALRSCRKGEYVLRAGEHIQSIMLLLEGALLIQKDDYWGKRSIISMIGVGEMFGEAYTAPESGALMNDVLALEDSVVMVFDVRRVLTLCPSACRFHSLTVQNLFFAVCEKNRRLMSKLALSTGRSTRDKLMAYLSEEAKRQGSAAFTIPFNRQQLADFLSVDRSAMSNELCKMRDDGLLSFERSHFTLYELPEHE